MNTTPSAVYYFVSGAIMLGHILAGMYFLRFWKRSQDRLFFFFAAAFFMLSAQRLALLFAGQTDEQSTVLLYGMRLAAFLLILAGIVDKNRASSGSRSAKTRGRTPLGKSKTGSGNE